jgi:uncharacterized protein (TIGR00251 family)
MYIEERENGAILRVKVTPGSSRNALAQLTEDRLTVKLTSPPVDGKANKQLIKFLSKKLGVSASSISIMRGVSSREKILFVAGVGGAELREKLEADPK